MICLWPRTVCLVFWTVAMCLSLDKNNVLSLTKHVSLLLSKNNASCVFNKSSALLLNKGNTCCIWTRTMSWTSTLSYAATWTHMTSWHERRDLVWLNLTLKSVRCILLVPKQCLAAEQQQCIASEQEQCLGLEGHSCIVFEQRPLSSFWPATTVCFWTETTCCRCATIIYFSCWARTMSCSWAIACQHNFKLTLRLNMYVV